MTKREVLTEVICARIAAGKALPSIENGRFTSRCWTELVEAICSTYPERDSRQSPPSVF